MAIHGVGSLLTTAKWPPGFVDGCEVAYATAATVTISTGSLRDSTDKVNMTVSAQLTANLGTAGANGLDTGSEATSTWYYVYVIMNGAGTVASLLSANATTPTMPSGYVYMRLVGAIKNDGSGDILPFFPAVGRQREFYYKTGAMSGDVDVNLGALTTAWTDADCSAFIPPIADNALLQLFIRGDNSTGVNMVPKGMTEHAPDAGTLNAWQFNAPTANARAGIQSWQAVGTDQVYRCVSGTANATIVRVSCLAYRLYL